MIWYQVVQDRFHNKMRLLNIMHRYMAFSHIRESATLKRFRESKEYIPEKYIIKDMSEAYEISHEQEKKGEINIETVVEVENTSECFNTEQFT